MLIVANCSWIDSKKAWMRDDILCMANGSTTNGTSVMSISFQLINARNVTATGTRTAEDDANISVRPSIMRTAFRSLIAREIRSPVFCRT